MAIIFLTPSPKDNSKWDGGSKFCSHNFGPPLQKEFKQRRRIQYFTFIIFLTSSCIAGACNFPS